MKKPPVLDPDEHAIKIGELFGTPIVVKGLTWLPVTQIGALALFTRLARTRNSKRNAVSCVAIGTGSMLVCLGSEWGHNLAHAAAAQRVNKPMDAMRITWGMPLVVYHDLNDESVSPSAHRFRALGGPLFNILLLPLAWSIGELAPLGGVKEVADIAVRTNLFLSTVSLLPLPGIDGGPILKWWLVERGRTPERADNAVRKVDGVLAPLLGIGALLAWLRGHRLTAWILGGMSVLSALFALGLLREE